MIQYTLSDKFYQEAESCDNILIARISPTLAMDTQPEFYLDVPDMNKLNKFISNCEKRLINTLIATNAKHVIL